MTAPGVPRGGGCVPRPREADCGDGIGLSTMEGIRERGACPSGENGRLQSDPAERLAGKDCGVEKSVMQGESSKWASMSSSGTSLTREESVEPLALLCFLPAPKLIRRAPPRNLRFPADNV